MFERILYKLKNRIPRILLLLVSLSLEIKMNSALSTTTQSIIDLAIDLARSCCPCIFQRYRNRYPDDYYYDYDHEYQFDSDWNNYRRAYFDNRRRAHFDDVPSVNYDYSSSSYVGSEDEDEEEYDLISMECCECYTDSGSGYEAELSGCTA